MPIDFTSFKRPDTIPQEALESPELIRFINESIDRQVEATASTARDQAEKAVRDKAIADQKVEDLRKRLDDAQTGGSGNDAIDKLKAQLSKAKEEAAQEYKAQLDSIKSDNDSLKAKLDETELSNYMRTQIQEYNAKYPQLKAVDGAEKYLVEEGKRAFKKTESGEFRAFDGDKPLTSASGFMTGVEFLSNLRDNPSTRIFFGQTQGSGATGSGASGAGSKIISRSDFEKLNPNERMSKVKSGVTIQDN